MFKHYEWVSWYYLLDWTSTEECATCSFLLLLRLEVLHIPDAYVF